MDTATPIVFATIMNANMVTTTTTTIPAHIDTAIPAIFDTTAMPERLDQEVDARHVITLSTTIPAQPELKPTTTAAISNTAIKQRDNEEPAMGREEEGGGIEKPD